MKIMKKLVFLFAMFTISVNCRANSPVLAQELAKLSEDEVASQIHDLFKSPEGRGILKKQLAAYPTEILANVLNTKFNATPDSLRGGLIWSFFVLDPPKMVFSGKEIQAWLVEKINGGLPAGMYYFILTDESAKAVMGVAKESMRRVTKAWSFHDGKQFSLLSAAFLASHGDEEALDLLDSLVEQRDFDSMIDMAYVIPAAVMSGNEKLIQKIRDIITTDTRSRSMGNSRPREMSFAQIAASACSFVIEGFPPVGSFWNGYPEGMKKKVHDWLKENPTHKIKPDSARVLFSATPFSTIIPAFFQAGW